MIYKKIETSYSAYDIFSCVKDKKNVFFLDSAMHENRLGEYSYIGYNPILTFESKEDEVVISGAARVTEIVKSNPFDKLKELYDRYQKNYQAPFPFVGGFVGYFGYDLCHFIEKLPRKAVDDVNIPDCFLGLYDGIFIIDHKKNQTFIAALGINEAEDVIIARLEALISDESNCDEKGCEYLENKPTKLRSNINRNEYIKAVEAVKDYIRSGDVYQANMTRRFDCEITVSPQDIYAKLRELNPAPFASYIDFGAGHILSSSPERFIKITGKHIETRPIKGTFPRGKTNEEDIAFREALLSSEKDKSELLMIVDLERNDIGKVAEIGSVKVPELFVIETYPTVHHLVATVTGTLKESCHIVDAIKATFPGGSITGAPKIRAMEVLYELEPTQRNIYTGSIGFIGLNGDMDLNIVIRTMVHKEGKVYFQVGGGIVWDSDPELEYEETLHKAKALMKTLNATLDETEI